MPGLLTPIAACSSAHDRAKAESHQTHETRVPETSACPVCALTPGPREDVRTDSVFTAAQHCPGPGDYVVTAVSFSSSLPRRTRYTV